MYIYYLFWKKDRCRVFWEIDETCFLTENLHRTICSCNACNRRGRRPRLYTSPEPLDSIALELKSMGLGRHYAISLEAESLQTSPRECYFPSGCSNTLSLSLSLSPIKPEPKTNHIRRQLINGNQSTKVINSRVWGGTLGTGGCDLWFNTRITEL